MKTLMTITLGILITAVSIGVPLVATAEPSTGWEHGRMHEGRMMHDGGKMGGHGAKRSFGQSWRTSLSDEQSKKIDKLRLSFKRSKYLLKAKIKQAKIELELLTSKDSPNKSDIDSKIDQITKLKKEKLDLKANHKISVRKLLTEDQRVQFDLARLKRMATGKHGKDKRY